MAFLYRTNACLLLSLLKSQVAITPFLHFILISYQFSSSIFHARVPCGINPVSPILRTHMEELQDQAILKHAKYSNVQHTSLRYYIDTETKHEYKLGSVDLTWATGTTLKQHKTQ